MPTPAGLYFPSLPHLLKIALIFVGILFTYTSEQSLGVGFLSSLWLNWFLNHQILERKRKAYGRLDASVREPECRSRVVPSSSVP